jgi:putative Mg2+ transporter-C (MgtC) family protein
LLDAVFVTVPLIAINVVLRPLSRYIDRRSLAALDTHALYRLRVTCSNQDKTAAEREITRAVAARSLVLRELRAEQVDETQTTIVQAVLESSTRDPVIMSQVAEEIRALPCTDSVDWTETESES